MKLLSTSLILMSVLISGCVSSELPAPRVTVPAQFEAAQATLPAADLDRWWTLFNDAQLRALIDEALVSAPDARTALARLREAEAVRRGALTSFDPQGNPNGSIGRTDTHISGVPPAEARALGAGTATVASSAFSVSWELDLFGRRHAAKQTADADLAAARFEYEATRLSLASTVASQLFQARGLAGQITETIETVRIAKDLARVARLRVTSGLGSESDAARLDTELAVAQSDLAGLQAQMLTARRSLLVLLGRGSEAIDTLPVTADLPTPPRPPTMTPGDAIRRRPDVAEAEQRLRSAAGTVRLDQLDLLPRLTLQPGASVMKLTGPGGYVESAWSVATGLFVPILDRARLLSEVEAQTARGEQAVIAYEHSVQTAYSEAENSLTTLSADLERLDRLTFAEQRASYAFSAQQQGYRAGIVDLDTLLQTEQSWRSSRIALVALRTSTLTDAVTSFKALGGGWSPNSTAGN